MVKTFNATRKGLLAAGCMIILSVFFFYGLHLPVNGYNQFVVLAIYVAAILWSLFSLKIRSGESAVFKAYFAEGFRAFIVITLLMVVYTFIFYKLNPQILENQININNALISKEANYTPAEIADNTNKLRSIFMPMTIAIKTFMYLLLGAIVSAIGAVALGKK